MTTSTLQSVSLNVVRMDPRAGVVAQLREVVDIGGKDADGRSRWSMPIALPVLRGARRKVMLEEACAEFDKARDRAAFGSWTFTPPAYKPPPPPGVGTPALVAVLAHEAARKVAMEWAVGPDDARELAQWTLEHVEVTFGGRTFRGSEGLRELDALLRRMLECDY